MADDWGGYQNSQYDHGYYADHSDHSLHGKGKGKGKGNGKGKGSHMEYDNFDGKGGGGGGGGGWDNRRNDGRCRNRGKGHRECNKMSEEMKELKLEEMMLKLSLVQLKMKQMDSQQNKNQDHRQANSFLPHKQESGNSELNEQVLVDSEEEDEEEGEFEDQNAWTHDWTHASERVNGKSCPHSAHHHKHQNTATWQKLGWYEKKIFRLKKKEQRLFSSIEHLEKAGEDDVNEWEIVDEEEGAHFDQCNEQDIQGKGKGREYNDQGKGKGGWGGKGKGKGGKGKGGWGGKGKGRGKGHEGLSDRHYQKFRLQTAIAITKSYAEVNMGFPKNTKYVLVDGNNVRGGGANRMSRQDVCNAVSTVQKQCCSKSLKEVNHSETISHKKDSLDTRSDSAMMVDGNIKFVVYFDGGSDGEVGGISTNTVEFDKFICGETETAKDASTNDTTSCHNDSKHIDKRQDFVVNDKVFIRCCHQELADDVIVSDIESKLNSCLVRVDKENKIQYLGPQDKNGVSDQSFSEQGGSEQEASSSSSPTSPTSSTLLNNHIVVVTSDRGLMLRCLDRDTLIMKCGPFLRLSHIHSQ